MCKYNSVEFNSRTRLGLLFNSSHPIQQCRLFWPWCSRRKKQFLREKNQISFPIIQKSKSRKKGPKIIFEILYSYTQKNVCRTEMDSFIQRSFENPRTFEYCIDIDSESLLRIHLLDLNIQASIKHMWCIRCMLSRQKLGSTANKDKVRSNIN